MAFRAYGKTLVKTPVKIAVLALTALLLAGGIYGVVEIPTEFDDTAWINEGNYVRDYLDIYADLFPSGGIGGSVYITEVDDFHAKMGHVKDLGNELAGMEALSGDSNVTGFHVDLESFIDGLEATNDAYPSGSYDENVFQTRLGAFLWTLGISYQREVTLKGDYECTTVPVPKLKTISIRYVHDR